MENSLFRPAVAEAQSDRLYGEVVLRSSFAVRVLTGVILLVVLVAGALLLSARYSRVERTQGILVPIEDTAKIYPLRPGVVTRLLVRDDAIVKQGQTLAIVTTETPNGAGAMGTDEALASIAKQSALAGRQVDLLGRRSTEDVERLDAAVSGLRAQLEMIGDQIRDQQELVTSTSRSYDQIGPLVAKGYVSKLEYERRYQTVLSAREDLSRLQQQQIGIRADIARTTREQARAALDGQNDQASARSTLETLRQQRGRVQGDQSYAIKAPISGRITALQTNLGRTVSGASPLMVVIPEHAHLRAELYVPSSAIGFIKPGQEVRLLYDAFPYQRFGSSTGRVDTISRQIVAGQETDAPFKIDGPVYRVTAFLDRQFVAAYGKDFSLQPGMTLQANIILERESFLDWVLDPLRAVAGRS